MLAVGVKAPAALEELENHLREDVERQMRSGASPLQAFEIAVQKIGLPNELRSEFRKNERATMKRYVTILLGVLSIFVGPAIILPALALHRDHGTWTTNMVVPVIAGSVIGLVGIGMAFYGSRMRRIKPC